MHRPSAPSLTATVVQCNPTLGDILGNTQKIRARYAEAESRGADLVITPELSVTGCPLEDLAASPELLDTAEAAVEALARITQSRRATLVVGAPVRGETGVHNAAFVLQNGRTIAVIRKKNLSRPGMPASDRNFAPDYEPNRLFTVNGVQIGLLIGEDAWMPEPAQKHREDGARLLIALAAAPFHPGSFQSRVRDMAAARTAETGLPVLCVSLVGGQDEVVFDGGSFLMHANGQLGMVLPQWEECAADCNPGQPSEPLDAGLFPDSLEEIWRAMTLGLRDYAGKSGFTDVVLGMSGGMDSALAAAVAGDALGCGRVHCLRLPSRYTSELSNTAAEEMCDLWGFSMQTLPIVRMVETAAEAVQPAASGELKQLTRENLQARTRGLLLMTLANECNWLLLSTGNKSEIAVGYATLYGDMCGGFNPLKDVFKTTVYALARWRNANRPAGLLGPSGVVIPEAIIERPPSAELAPGQRDSDSLPPYPILDAILEMLLERGLPRSDIIASGHQPETVDRICRLVKRAEFKRRQSAPGPKTSIRAFSRDRQMPMVNALEPDMIAQLLALP